jgi:hypothetical protein
MEKRFPALHVVSAIFKILAWLVAVVDVVLVVITLIPRRVPFYGTLSTPNYLIALAILLGGALYFLFLYAFAEGIMVGLAIEENTRTALKEKDKQA